MNNQESEDRSSAPATSFPGFAPSRVRSEREHWERGRRAEVKPLLTLQVLTYTGKLLCELRGTVSAVSI